MSSTSFSHDSGGNIPPCGWLGDVATFLETPEEKILSSLTSYLRQTGAPQVYAWDRSLRVLRDQLSACMPLASGFAVVLEFELPRTGGRRPDLIVLENGLVLIIEFKNRVAFEPQDLDQVKGYVRDLGEYHSGCRGKTLVPILVPIGMQGDSEELDGVRIVPPSRLGALIRELSRGGASAGADGNAWVRAPYEPLPALVEAARLLFERQPLPRIRTAESAHIPETLGRLEALAREAREKKKRILALVSGVPGSGKTLVGLQLVHSRALGGPAVFLSGNGPLVQTLQYSLGNREFVRDIKKFIHEHLIRTSSAPRERVIVFDEAQRAWDRDRVLKKHRGRLTEGEPALLARIAARADDGFLLVALLGTGQEIHEGEEGGLAQWVEAFGSAGGWEVAGPPAFENEFLDSGLPWRGDNLLQLSATLRSHRASNMTQWAERFLEGRLPAAALLATEMRAQGYHIRGSRSLEALRIFARDLYGGSSTARYGLIASSRFRNLEAYGVRTPPARYFNHGAWYENPADERNFCRGLEVAETEFGCQGLELDFPIVCWGPDLVWREGRWEAIIRRRNPHVRDAAKLRLNAYRVLLTRGRDGLAVFVPPAGSAMDATWQALLAGGMEALK
ncbi:MAG: DUF2075 domain-containing protein [Elusimicrobia bacterium]|nr:DUF2075 domain-containing protein [Elusimicrobiota bacterium]